MIWPLASESRGHRPTGWPIGRSPLAKVDEAIRLVNHTLACGVHQTHPDALSLYYSDTLILHYFLTRAYREGHVWALKPSVERLVEDLLASVQTDEQGRYFWNRGSPDMNTAFAALALMNAEVAPDIVAGAIDFLTSRQHPRTGAWEAGLIRMAELDNGSQVYWRSKPVTTAWVLEALCRHKLRGGRGDWDPDNRTSSDRPIRIAPDTGAKGILGPVANRG